jgi:ribosomal protein L29
VNGLTAYRHSRLELGDMIRAALHLARGSDDEESEKRARDLLARLAADRFQLAIVGQLSRGKTTLMNALLGGAYLPMGALPMTSVITTVRYGSQPRATGCCGTALQDSRPPPPALSVAEAISHRWRLEASFITCHDFTAPS